VSFDVDGARTFAAKTLAEHQEWWLHAQGTARRAEEIAPVVSPLDRQALICAAWLHDVGNCAVAVRTGFHPVDGALYLAEAGWPSNVVALVAHHCEARITAAALEMGAELERFGREDGALNDALIYADMLVGQDGRRVSLRRRLDEIGSRHADEPPALREAWIVDVPH
jgi:HD superfamily phosphodiesterase